MKTLILVKFEKDKIFNASTCGDNCAKWLLKIAESEDRTINLHHLMNFGNEKFTIRIVNTDQVVHSMEELVSISEIDRVLQLIERRKNVALYLPESFEWMILSAGILKNSQVENIVNNPAEFVESREYFSWERFFTAVLIEATKDTYLVYAKRKLNIAYLSQPIEKMILGQMEKVELTGGIRKNKKPVSL